MSTAYFDEEFLAMAPKLSDLKHTPRSDNHEKSTPREGSPSPANAAERPGESPSHTGEGATPISAPEPLGILSQKQTTTGEDFRGFSHYGRGGNALWLPDNQMLAMNRQCTAHLGPPAEAVVPKGLPAAYLADMAEGGRAGGPCQSCDPEEGGEQTQVVRLTEANLTKLASFNKGA